MCTRGSVIHGVSKNTRNSMLGHWALLSKLFNMTCCDRVLGRKKGGRLDCPPFASSTWHFCYDLKCDSSAPLHTVPSLPPAAPTWAHTEFVDVLSQLDVLH